MYYRIHEAAEKLNCSASTLRGYEKAGYLVPVIKYESGERRYSEEQIKEFLDKYTTDEYKAQSNPEGVDDFWMTPEAVCEYIGCSVSKLNRLKQDGTLEPGYVLPGNGRRFYSSVAVYEYMKSIINA